MLCITKPYVNITIFSTLNQNWQQYSAAVCFQRENTKDRVWLHLNYCLKNIYNCREFASPLQSHSGSNIPPSMLQASSSAQHKAFGELIVMVMWSSTDRFISQFLGIKKDRPATEAHCQISILIAERETERRKESKCTILLPLWGREAGLRSTRTTN